MAANGTMSATRIAAAPRWRGLALAALVLAGASVAAGGVYEAVRISNPAPVVDVGTFGTHKGIDRGQVEGITDAQVDEIAIRPGTHGGGAVKGA